MTTFHDALSGKKIKFNLKTKATKAPFIKAPWCQDSVWVMWHDFPSETDDLCVCERCGTTLIRARALENMRKT